MIGVDEKLSYLKENEGTKLVSREKSDTECESLIKNEENDAIFFYNELIYKKKLRNQKKTNKRVEEKRYQGGKWDFEEHLNFILGIIKNGNDWKHSQKTMYKTRSCIQARSHCQKFFGKISRLQIFGITEYCSSVKIFHESAKRIKKEKLMKVVEFMMLLHFDFHPLNAEQRKLIDCKISLLKNKLTPTEKLCFYSLPPHLSELNNFSHFCEKFKWEGFTKLDNLTKLKCIDKKGN
jgi:hypothetical protein